MIAIKRSAWLVLFLTLAACVTVNIYFPAAAAEKAAEQIIDDIWQEKEVNVLPVNDKQNAHNYTPANLNQQFRQWIANVLEATVSPVYAQNVDFNVSSAKISTLKSNMANRFGQMRPYYDSGAVGLANDGYVVLRDANAVAMAERGKVQQLVGAENADRRALYAAIAEANNQPSWAEHIRQTFANRWIEQAKSGWWVQTSHGWQQK